jgi:multidrug efflux pump subunit AcrA (membrane-fusion protein)
MQIKISKIEISRQPSPALCCMLAGALLLVTPMPLCAADKANNYLGPVVTAAKAKKTCLSDSIDITGALVAKNEIVVRPEQEGYQISKVLVEVGDSVTSGQALARLTPPEGQSGGSVTVESPGAGVVGKVAAVVGSLTSSRAPPLFEIIGNGEIELSADVPTKVIGQLSPGQPAKVTIVGIGMLPGRVRVVSPIVNAATQLGSARIFIGKDKQLRIGTFGRASIVAGKSCNVVVPLSAVLYSSVGAIVEVVHDSKIETRKVVLGLLSGGVVEIREGLSEGDVVVSRAGAFLREGDRVRPAIADESVDKK